MRKEIIGNATLYQGDCLEVLSGINLDGLDTIVTDPPFGIDIQYGIYHDTPENLNVLIERLFKLISDIKKVVMPGPGQIQDYPKADWVGAVTWNTTGSYGKYGYSQWTPILLYGEDLKGMGSVNGVLKSDVLRLKGGGGVGFQRDSLAKEHPCPKPVNIMDYVVRRYTDQNSRIIDPLMGSGTTGISCANVGREFIGIEIEPKYFDIACKRIEQAQRQGNLFTDKEG